MTDQESKFNFRWGVPWLDDKGYIEIPGFIKRNYAKLGIKPAEMMMIAHLSSYKYDTQRGESRPSLKTIAAEMGYARDTQVRKMVGRLEESKVLAVKRHKGHPSTYDFGKLAKDCMKLELESPTNEEYPPNEGDSTPQKDRTVPPKRGDEDSKHSNNREVKDYTAATAAGDAPCEDTIDAIDAALMAHTRATATGTVTFEEMCENLDIDIDAPRYAIGTTLYHRSQQYIVTAIVPQDGDGLQWYDLDCEGETVRRSETDLACYLLPPAAGDAPRSEHAPPLLDAALMDAEATAEAIDAIVDAMTPEPPAPVPPDWTANVDYDAPRYAIGTELYHRSQQYIVTAIVPQDGDGLQWYDLDCEGETVRRSETDMEAWLLPPAPKFEVGGRVVVGDSVEGNAWTIQDKQQSEKHGHWIYFIKSQDASSEKWVYEVSLTQTPAPPAPEKRKADKPPTPHAAMKNAIVAAFGWQTDDVANWGVIDSASKKLRKVDVLPDDVDGLYRHTKATLRDGQFGPGALPNYVADWRAKKRNGDKTSANVIGAPEDVDRAASFEATRQALEG